MLQDFYKPSDLMFRRNERRFFQNAVQLDEIKFFGIHALVVQTTPQLKFTAKYGSDC